MKSSCRPRARCISGLASLCKGLWTSKADLTSAELPARFPPASEPREKYFPVTVTVTVGTHTHIHTLRMCLLEGEGKGECLLAASCLRQSQTKGQSPCWSDDGEDLFTALLVFKIKEQFFSG